MIFSNIKYFFNASAFMLLILTQESDSEVLPPSNVTIRCQNFKTTAHWSYIGDTSQIYFSVEIHREIEYEDPKIMNTTDNHCDISSLITSIDNSYYLTVTAINGSEKSSPARSSDFSYDTYMPAHDLCELDFSSVNISIRSGKITVYFVHPLLLYKNTLVLRNLKKKRPKEYNEHKTFNYDVTINELQTTEKSECCVQDTCSATFPVMEKLEKYCVRLRGMMKNTVVRSSELTCGNEEPETSWSLMWIIYILCPLVVILSILVFGAMFMKNIKTPSLPKIIVSVLSNKCSEQMTIQPETVSTLHVSSLEPCVRSDILQEELKTCNTDVSSPDFRCPIGQLDMKEHSCSQGLLDAQDLRYPDLTVSSEHLRNLESEQWESVGNSFNASGYDRPHALLEVELVPGDIVEGYGSSVI